ncbi:MAG TPA: hypothetical protein VN719_05780 [Gemmatimonadales bacterium]|nr:hypothetical protein [Gemmatimonadales bacterium]
MSDHSAIRLTFAQASRLVDPTARREFLLERIQEIYEGAMGRTYTNKRGEQLANPDGIVALKCVEVVGRWAGYDAAANMQAAADAARAAQMGTASDVELLTQLLDQVPADMLLSALQKREAAAALPEKRPRRERTIETTGESGGGTGTQEDPEGHQLPAEPGERGEGGWG